MAKKIFVGGIKREASQEDIKKGLTDSFSQYGEVGEVIVIIDRFTGKCKGFAFVEMPNAEEADAAIAQLNGTVIEGITFNKLTVNEARPKEEHSDQRNGGFNKFQGGNNFNRR